ncbi:ATP-binding protein [Pseudonocardia sp.]|uniref:ATP-binding protein n=1 Tax=Pseudonocardia sp. TaxID=60912 RepID=UPI003D125117
MTDRITTEELRGLFLFEALDEAKLAWLAEHARVVSAPAGTVLCAEGEPADCFHVLLTGTVAMSRRIGPDDVETTRTDQRGVYFGAVQFYLDDDSARIYPATVRAITDITAIALPAVEFARAFADWFPMAVHLLEGLLLGMKRGNAAVAQRERLLALGKLTAGLTHELNNPAAAAGRAAHALRDRVSAMRHKLGMIASGRMNRDHLQALVEIQEKFVEIAAEPPRLTSLQAADAEDEVADWLDEQGIAGGWELAPVFVAAGLGADQLEAVRAAAPPDALEGAIRWLSYTVETESLMREIADSAERIAALVGAAKQYSQLDRAPHQFFDLHAGLDATLVMLGPKLGGIQVVKDYDPAVPQIPGYPAELNQVWTNLIVNARDAMDGSGTLTLRTRVVEDCVEAEVTDTGTGIPPEIQGRIFEPFFTTKPVGHGTGLGLDVSYRVVVGRHHGDLQVDSEPGRTTFTVRLPVQEPPAQG